MRPTPPTLPLRLALDSSGHRQPHHRVDSDQCSRRRRWHLRRPAQAGLRRAPRYVIRPSGVTASNFNFQGTVNLGTAANNYANLYVNENSTVYVQPGGSITLTGDSTPRSELFLHGTNAFIRFDEDGAINDSTTSRIWKFNRFNITSNNVATLGDTTNIVNSLSGSAGFIPVGGIIAWHKSFANTPALPAQFVECNGQTLSDAGSVFNGQVIPNLKATTASSAAAARPAAREAPQPTPTPSTSRSTSPV